MRAGTNQKRVNLYYNIYWIVCLSNKSICHLSVMPDVMNSQRLIVKSFIFKYESEFKITSFLS